MAVRERPILMSAPMVRALLEDRKTQTRRTVKKFTPCGDTILAVCPYGVPGDRLWVRETWSGVDTTHPRQGEEVAYRADGDFYGVGFIWRPSIFMPRWASRITLEITEVRVQKLQDISDKGCFAEGIQHVVNEGQKDDGSARGAYKALWESINGLGSWILNPWVFAISFHRI